VLSGSDDGAAAAAERVHTYIHTEHPLVEISAFAGGQPHFPLLIGVE
jgi:dihydroxyacetone kinase-like predicted kinase